MMMIIIMRVVTMATTATMAAMETRVAIMKTTPMMAMLAKMATREVRTTTLVALTMTPASTNVSPSTPSRGWLLLHHPCTLLARQSRCIITSGMTLR